MIATTIDPFALEHAEESFSQRIVGTAAHGTHAADNIVPLQKALILVAGELAAAEFHKVLSGGAMDMDLLGELDEARLSHFSIPYWMNDETVKNNLSLQGVLHSVGQGDFSQINTPQTLGLIESVYKDQLDIGAGELSASAGKPIVRKGLAGFRAAPGGAGFVALLNVEYQDGSTDTKPITLNRSSAAEDPVAVKDIGEMMDDVASRVQLAQIFSQPAVRKAIEAGNAHLFNKGGDKGKATTEIRNIEYLVGNGIERDEAIEMVMFAKENPNSLIAQLFKTSIDNDLSKEPAGANEHMRRAVDAYRTMKHELSGDGGGAPGAGGAVLPGNLPSPLKYKGKVIRGKDGKAYKSDGQQWYGA